MKTPSANGIVRSRHARRGLRSTLVIGATTALMGLGLAAASAHVSATPSDTAANSYSLLTFSVPHGCDGSPTTKVAITLPTELNDATPTVNPNWTISKTVEKLPAPVKQANGSSITERTSQITYTAKTPLDPHQRDALVLSLQVPDAVGKTLYFPTLQTCEKGQTDWKEIPAAGQSEDDLNAPAPSMAVTAAQAEPASGVSTSSATGEGNSTTGEGSSATSAGNDDDASQAPGWIGLGAGLAGLVLGGLALARTRTAASPARATTSGTPEK